MFGAVRHARKHLGDPFVLGYGDVLPSTRPRDLAGALVAGADGVVLAWENRGAGEPSNLAVRDGRAVTYGRVDGATHLDVGMTALRRSALDSLAPDLLGGLAARGALAVLEVGGPSLQIGDPEHYNEVRAVPPGALERPPPRPRILLLDREGGLLRHVDPYVLSPEDVRPIAGAFEAAGAFARAGCRIAVVTNQSPIARGLATPEFVERTSEWLVARLAEHGAPGVRVYVCPHDDTAGCYCRKPAPGLLTRAMRDAGVEPSDAWMVGDHDTDLLAARAAGCRVRVHARSGRMLRPSSFATHVVPDLAGLATLSGTLGPRPD